MRRMRRFGSPTCNGIALATAFLWALAPLHAQESVSGDDDGGGFALTVLPPGFGVGVAGGLYGLGGADNAVVRDAATTEVFGRYGFSSYLALRAGTHISRRTLATLRYPYQLFGVYLEPRYVHPSLSPAWAPFAAVQLGYLRESVAYADMELSAWGGSMGAGGGAVFRLSPQVAAELGAVGGVVRFADYTFRGERAWYQCLNALDAGTGLPGSVEQCAGARDLGAVLCYPPFYPSQVSRISSDCAPPKIPYGNTARSGSWFRLWFAVHFSLAEP